MFQVKHRLKTDTFAETVYVHIMHVMPQQVFRKIFNKINFKFNEARKFLVKWLDISFIQLHSKLRI